MTSTQKLKDLRDALWQAAIETKVRFAEEAVDPYSRPAAEIVERLEDAGNLTDADARLLHAFLNQYDDEDYSEISEEITDEVDTEISRIVAHLRSLRLPDGA